MAEKKAIMVVDGAFVFNGAKKTGKFDYGKLSSFVGQMLGSIGASLHSSYYFNSVTDPPKAAQNSFHSSLKHQHWVVKLSGLKARQVWCKAPDCKHKKEHHHSKETAISDVVQQGVDVNLVTTVLTKAAQNEFDILVLVAGDSDFKDAIHWIREVKGKDLWLLGFHGSVSAELTSLATLFKKEEDLALLPVWDLTPKKSFKIRSKQWPSWYLRVVNSAVASTNDVSLASEFVLEKLATSDRFLLKVVSEEPQYLFATTQTKPNAEVWCYHKDPDSQGHWMIQSSAEGTRLLVEWGAPRVLALTMDGGKEGHIFALDPKQEAGPQSWDLVD